MAAPRPQPNLSLPASRFIGRGADLAAIDGLFAEGRRLVTLWGPAGMGKTRLAQELLRIRVQAHPEERAWFCELTEARDLGAFCGAVARALGAAVAAGKKDAGTVARIGRVLAAQGPALLVLDNLEQVIEPAAAAVGAWAKAAPEVRFLVTSRERTRLPGEVSYELAPLGLPEGAGAGSEAVDLFLDRVNAQRPRRPLGAESAPIVAELVRKLEGIPLAIELAAARADVLGLDGLLSRLPDRLELLGGGVRGVEARQATMRNAVAWSWDLLDEPDRRALARCSVLRGGFSLAAADAVLGEPAEARIQSLHDKSLLRALSQGPTRFALYEAVRQLAAEKLAERGEQDLVCRLHAAHYLAAGEAHAADWEQRGAVEALDRIGEDLPNLLAVVERALGTAETAAAPGPAPAPASATDALRALVAIDPLLGTRGPFGIHLPLLDRALAGGRTAGVDPLLDARALSARGRARHLRGQEVEGLADIEEARDRARASADRAASDGPRAATHAESVLAGILADIGVIHHQRRAMDPARACYEEALTLQRRAGNRRAEGRLLGNLGALHHDAGRFDEAMAHYEPALALAVAAADRRTEGIFSANLGLLAQERGAALEARQRYEHAVTVLTQVGDLRLLAITLGNLGALHHEEGALDEARRTHARAVALLGEVGDRRSEARAEGRLGAALASLGLVAEARAALRRAERLLAGGGDPLDAAILALAHGFLDVALARAARSEARPEEAASYLQSAARRMARARDPSLLARSDDIRTGLRLLGRSLAAVDDAAPPAVELLLAPDARWCRPPGGSWQDLRERHAVRRLLLRLSEVRTTRPGHGISLAELQEAGWPGEHILPEAASNRIYVAVSQLRKLGLKDWLKRGGDGYYLDPALPVHHTAVEPIPGG